ncbi:MAG: class I SAM-dependent methyltransferase [Spirosomataceae bacterium]
MTLSDEQISFIQQHLQQNPTSLLLKYGKEKEFLVGQIESRQKARYKLPEWYAEPRLVFPPAVSVEQSSSELTGRYKASLVAGTHLIDATGGMGIDAYFFSQRCESVTYIEQHEQLVQTAQHNFEVLRVANIHCIQGNSMEFLQQPENKADWIYVDPARRAADNRRVVGLKDCEPDVIQHLPLLLKKTKQLLIKASPLLDIRQTLIDLPFIKAVHVVAVDNECKELLFELAASGSYKPSPLIKTVNFKNDGRSQFFDFYRDEETAAAVTLSNPKRYLYEPNAAILKAGAFKSVAGAYQLAKIAPHSHLYTSDDVKTDFPGRIFEVLAIVKADTKVLMPYLPDGKANLFIRNFPATTDDLRKKLKLKDGGDVYLPATTLSNGEKRLLVCKKVDPYVF